MLHGPSPRPNRQRSRTETGLTLVELLVVMTIAGILLALATPSFTRQIAEGQRGNAISALTKSFSLARSSSIRSSRSVALCISTDQTSCAATATGDWSQGWIVYSDVNSDSSFTTGTDQILLVQLPLQGLTKAQSSPSVNNFAFLPNGMLNANANAITIQSKNSSITDKTVNLTRLGRLALAE